MFNLPNDQAKHRFQEAFLRIELAYEKALGHRLHVDLETLAQNAAQAYEAGDLSAALSMISQFESSIQRHLIHYLTQTYIRFADEAVSTLNPSVMGSPQFLLAAQRYVRTYGAIKVKRISEATRVQLQQVIEKSLLENLSVPQVQRRIVEKAGGQIARKRARTIAQTEVHAAANAGAHAAVESLNRPYRKEWISALQPGRTRAWHLAAHGQIVDGNAQFLVDGEYLRYPADPMGSARNVINCRCVNGYLL